MVKATLRSAVLLGIVAIGMAITSMPSFAEVQNVRVGGDITVRAFHRENLDLNDENAVGTGTGTGPLTSDTAQAFDANDDFIMSTVGINVGADLTENVSAFIRMANERDWDKNGTASGDFDLSQAYVTLKELFYSPLTLRVGTQPITWGRGFVLGSNLLPSVLLLATPEDRNASISANEFTDFTSFDAIRATLDLSAGTGLPLTVDYVYIKSEESVSGLPDDQTLQGFNISTQFDSMNAELETYYLNLRDKDLGGCSSTVTAAQAGECKNGSVNTIGFRGSTQPVEGANLYGEVAYQFGKRVVDLETILASGDSQQAWGMNLGGDYTFADMTSTPTLGAEWRYYSGKNVDAAVTGWRAIAPGLFTTALREFQTRSTIATGFYPNDQTGVTSGQTNQHELATYGSFKPIEDLTVNQRLSWFVLPVGAIQATTPAAPANRNSFLGAEWDSVLTYDYTDDVQFGLIYALFVPGSVFRVADSAGPTTGDSTAQELITSVSVKF